MKKIIAFLMSFVIGFGCLSVTAFAATAYSIPSGAKLYNGHYYYVYASQVNWNQAKKLCEKRGGHLVTVTSKGENKFVANLVNSKNIGSCWYGATDVKAEGKWKWVTGEKFSYTAWYEGEPNNSYEGEHYLGSFGDGQTKWNDFKLSPYDTDAFGGYVCEWDFGQITDVEQLDATTSSVTVSWENVDEAEKYYVYLYDSSAKKYVKYKTVTRSAVKIEGLKSGATHKIAIAYVFNNNGESKRSPVVYFKAVTKTGKTTGVKFGSTTSLVWNAVSGADGYVIYSYDSAASKWETYDSSKKTSCKIEKKTGRKKQYFKVRAYKKSEDGSRFYGAYSSKAKR